MKINALLGFILLPSIGFFTPQAAGDTYNLVATISSLTPLYVQGHEGDPTQIGGFDYVFDLTLNGSIIGSETGKIELYHPPMSLSDPYFDGHSNGFSTLSGLGSIQTDCVFGFVTTDATATRGTVATGALCRLDNGTGDLRGAVGVLTYSGSINLLAYRGSLDIVANIPDGVQ